MKSRLIKLSSLGMVLGMALSISACGSSATPTTAPAAGTDATATTAPAAAAPTDTAAMSSAATVAPTAASSTSGAMTKVSIMVGGLNKHIYLPAKLTDQLGYFKDEGLDISLLDEPAGVDAETAMLAGQVQGVVGFYDHNLDLQGKGKSTESVVQLDWVPGEVELVDSKKADQIKSPADFKGRNLGVTGLGSSTNFLTQYLAVKNGVPIDQIHSVAVGAGNTFIAALQHGQIDAGMTTEPTISRLLKTGEAKILVDMRTAEGTKAALGGTYPAACLYMQTEFVNANKPTVQKLANAFVKTLKWIHSHTADEIAAKMPADYYAGDQALYVNALKGGLGMYTSDGKMPTDGPPTVLNVLSAFDPNVKGKNIDLSKTYTTEFVDNVK
jgi:NitT/TauT family transport system substrate-binding protein